MNFFKRIFTWIFSSQYKAEYVYEDNNIKTQQSDLMTDLAMTAAIARLDEWGLKKYTVFENIRGNWVFKKEKSFI